MLFVRCKGGVSHKPAESVTISVTIEDVGVAIDLLSRFLELLAQQQLNTALATV
jgi:allantoate deiminase